MRLKKNLIYPLVLILLPFIVPAILLYATSDSSAEMHVEDSPVSKFCKISDHPFAKDSSEIESDEIQGNR